MAIPIIALLTIFIALAGGLQFYWSPLVGASCTLLGLVAIPWAGWLWRAGHRPPIFLPLAVLLAPMMLSALANPEIWPIALSRILLFIVALAVLVIAGSQNQADLQAGLWWAGLAWPVVWWGLTMAGYRAYQQNIIAVWPLVFCLIGLRAGAVWYAIPHLIMLALLGSRGAIIGLGGGLWVLYFYHRRALPRWAVGLVVLVIIGLVAARWDTTLARLHYWVYALSAWLNSPILGIGPGGIKALQSIPEFNDLHGVYTIHAHNFFISYLTETGLVGLVGLAAAGYLSASRLAFSRWQLAIVIALALHSLVDEPLWWPGPLILAAAVAGARREIWTFIPPGWKRYQPETNII